MLSHLRSVALEMEAADRAKKGKERTAHVQLDRSQRDSSIQERIHAQLREQGKRVQDLFRSWDDDGSNSIEKAEFRAALIELKIQGTPADFDALFDVWDADGSGSLQYTELTAALSGARYDAFLDAPPAPPLPPLLICAPSNPFPHNPRFLDDVGILTTLATKAAGSPQAKRAFEKAGGEGNLGGSRPARNRAAATLLPPYTPLGLRRGGEEERLAGLAPCTDVPSWSRPEIHCDPSGGPQHRELLPVGQVWRKVFGTARPLPLWIGYTPGSLFAVSMTAVLATRPPYTKHAPLVPPPPPPPSAADAAAARAAKTAAKFAAAAANNKASTDTLHSRGRRQQRQARRRRRRHHPRRRPCRGRRLRRHRRLGRHAAAQSAKARDGVGILSEGGGGVPRAAATGWRRSEERGRVVRGV